jgi:hypothetical protein
MAGDRIQNRFQGSKIDYLPGINKIDYLPGVNK